MWCFFLCILAIGLPCLKANLDGDACCDMGMFFAKNSYKKEECMVFPQHYAISSCFQTAKMCCEKYFTSPRFKRAMRRPRRRHSRISRISTGTEKIEYSRKTAGEMDNTTSINKSEKTVKAITSTNEGDFINELKVADEPNKTIRSVSCSIGFKSDINGVCTDVDECSEGIHNCSHGCLNTIGSHVCSCMIGFELFSGLCADVDECATKQDNCNKTTQSCVNTIGSFICISTFFSTIILDNKGRPLTDEENTTEIGDPNNEVNNETNCPANYKVDINGVCADIDECSEGTHLCDSHQICLNTNGSHECHCKPGFELDPITGACVDIDECSNGEAKCGGPKQFCTNLPGGYTCNCSKGYTLIGDHECAAVVDDPKNKTIDQINCPIGYKNVRKGICDDIDECSTGEAKCGSKQFCTNLPGGYVCDCPEGYKLIGDKCADVDECALPKPICPQNADCVNTIGSYKCQCQHGFRSPRSSDKYCEDINECFGNGGRILCEHQCHNEWGGYSCACHRGYRLNPDNRTCSDIDECTENKSKGSLCAWRCHNNLGSYKCSCPSGYTLSEDEKTCVDIDECVTSPCSGDSVRCINSPGGYGCHRIDCLPGYHQEVENRCTKEDKQCSLLDWECAHQPIYYSYEFISLVSNITIPGCKVDLFTYSSWQPELVGRFSYKLDLINGFAPPYVQKADSSYFTLTQKDDQGVVSLVRPIEGPQSVVLDLTMEVYNIDQKFVGSAMVQIVISVSEYGF